MDEPLDPEVRLLFCVCSTLPYKVLRRAERRVGDGDPESITLTLLMRDALHQIIDDLRTVRGARFFYGHNDLARFEEELALVHREIRTFGSDGAAMGRYEYYQVIARSLPAGRLAAAIVDFEEGAPV